MRSTAKYLSPLFLTLLLLTGQPCRAEIQSQYPVDIAFIVVDLKYNERQGVQVCEFQPGTLSAFKGWQSNGNSDEAISHVFCNTLSLYFNHVWYRSSDFSEPSIPLEMKQWGWSEFKSIKSLSKSSSYKRISKAAVYDPHNIYHYGGLLLCRKYMIESPSDFIADNPSTVIIDRSLYPFWNDKYVMNQLFDSDEILKQRKPRWGLYPKVYDSSLAKKIHQELASEAYVIKPIGSALGNGVIIVSKTELDSTLERIIKDKKKLKKNKDSSYRYWVSDKNTSFLVEEFASSDPVEAAHLGRGVFDGTMRAVYLMAYHQHQIQTHFLGCYWKFPAYPLSGTRTLNDEHKSCGLHDHYDAVDKATQKEVKEQLDEAMPILYQKMLEYRASVLKTMPSRTINT